MPSDETLETGAECWSCDAPATGERLEVESMIHSRRADDGGPYRSYRCAGCGTTNGVLEGPGGTWMLYPLEGADDPTLIDWISPRFSRRSLRAAVEWWARHRGRVIRFRRAGSPGGRRRAKRPPPAAGRKRRGKSARPKPPPREERRAAPPPPPPPPNDPPPRSSATAPSARRPRELLGVGPEPTVEEVKSAYRRALKLCHPDRVANLDPEIQDLAHRKAKALRRAYESLLRELGAD